jgi:hypothetical protein
VEKTWIDLSGISLKDILLTHLAMKYPSVTELKSKWSASKVWFGLVQRAYRRSVCAWNIRRGSHYADLNSWNHFKWHRRSCTSAFEFEANVIGGTEPYSISWDFDDDGSEGSDDDERTVLHTFDEAGKYNVTLTATDTDNQNASDSMRSKSGACWSGLGGWNHPRTLLDRADANQTGAAENNARDAKSARQ